jgi:hypothetical protein
MRYKLFLISLLLIFLTSYGFAREKEGKTGFYKPTVIGVLDTIDVNNIYLPFRNDGSTAEQAQAYYPNPGRDPAAQVAANSFLWMGGFAASGYVRDENGNRELRASWMAPASLIQEWQPGKWGMNPDDDLAIFYKVRKSDGPGSAVYHAWADAVSLGADFQDVNGDDIYDPNIDHPDMLGDRISWCVINDNTDISVRTDGLLTDPIELELHQQVWAFARADELGDVIFFRYRFINTTPGDIEDLIFSIWTDPDIGDATDDLIGSDTTLSMGYIYNEGEDDDYGSNPPAFGVDFFQGPVVESPGDTAFRFRGPWFGIDTLYDMRNLPMTSFTFYNNDPTSSTNFPSPQGNPDMARIYQEGGRTGLGDTVDATLFGIGGEPDDNPFFFYPGDPGTSIRPASGWRDNVGRDKRFMVNTGPFQLPSWEDQNGNGRPDIGEPGIQDIVVAYIVGQSSEGPLESVDVLKHTDAIAQLAYDANFFVAGPPPPPKTTVRTFDNKIEFIIDLDANGTFSYDQLDELLNRQVFEGVKIYHMNSPSTNEFENGQRNRILIGKFDVGNEYRDIYQESGLETVRIYAGANNVDTTLIKDEGGAVLKFTVTTDVFNENNPLVNNTEYYFSVTAFSINRPFLEDLGGGSWRGGSGILLENNLGGSQLYRVISGIDENTPFLSDTAVYTGSRPDHDGRVLVDVVDRNVLRGDDYSVSFFNDGELWRVTNDTRNELLRDSLKFQDTEGEAWSFPIIDGLSIKVQNVRDSLSTAELVLADTTDTTSTVWLEGNPGANYSDRAIFDGGIDYVKFAKASLSTIKRDEYFPVEIEFDVTDVSNGYWFVGPNFNIFREPIPITLRAFDISDPDNKRQLNICYRTSSPVNSELNFNNNDIFIMTSDYAD